MAPPQQQGKTNPPQDVFPIPTQPGIQRDGSVLDSMLYIDGGWVRFQRRRPRKIGGYKAVSGQVSGPIRGTTIDKRGGVDRIHTMSQWGIQQLVIDDTGAGGAVVDRTPSGFTPNALYNWSYDQMYSQVGSVFTALVTVAAPDLLDITSDIAGAVYAGDITATTALTPIIDNTTSAPLANPAGGAITGCVVLQPFLFVYGSNGMIRNSNANDYTGTSATVGGWATFAVAGGANLGNVAYVAGTKVVKGLPVRGGSLAPAGMFWALDSLIRVSFIGTPQVFRYDTVSDQITVLSRNGIIEYDGIFYWSGVDRFYYYNGTVQELPNQTNLNFFFDNMNFSMRQKVWCIKIPRWGEIWWFYPFGSAQECTNAVVFNVRENCWYDVTLSRISGASPQIFNYPVMSGGEDSATYDYIVVTGITGTFVVGETITGGTSGAAGTIVRIINSGQINVNRTTTLDFANGETVTGSTSGATGTTSAGQLQEIDVVWQHEYQFDKINTIGTTTSIPSWFETSRFGLPTGGAVGSQVGLNAQTRVVRVEPDFFHQSGAMTVTVQGTSCANSPIVAQQVMSFTNTTEHVDPRAMSREISLRFDSNVLGGNYECGRVLIITEVADERS